MNYMKKHLWRWAPFALLISVILFTEPDTWKEIFEGFGDRLSNWGAQRLEW